MALRNMLVRVGADVSQLKKGMKEATNSVAYFGRSVADTMKGIKGKIAGAMAIGGGGFLLGQGVQDAMKYEALMTTLGETVGASRKEFEKWQNTVGNAMGFSKLQGAELANMLSLNFKSIATDAEDLVKKTTDMMQLASVISSKRGMAMSEVSDRIRSAMNQEADGAMELGVDVRIAAIKAGEAYQQMADGQPWDKLTENMRKTILYHHIFEQVSKNLGMTMQDTTAMRMASFTASLADVRLALGQAFTPILYAVLPLLNKMAQALYRVLTVIGAFMRSLFGGFKFQGKQNKAMAGGVAPIQAQTDAVKGLGDAQEKTGKKTEKAGKATKKATKEAKRGIASFDEINQLTDPAGAGAGAGGAGAGGIGGGAGGAGGLGDLAGPQMPAWDLKPFDDSLNAMADKFKKFTEPIRKLAKQVWTAISSFAIQKFKEIGAWWAQNGKQISQGFSNAWDLIKPVIVFVTKFVWESIKGLVSGVITFFQGVTEFLAGVFTGDWKMAWEGMKKIFFGAFQAIWNFTNLTLLGGIKKIFLTLSKDGIKIVLGLGTKIKEIFSTTAIDAIKSFQNLLRSIRTFFTDHGRWLYNEGIRIANNVISAFEKIGSVGNTIINAIKGAFSGLVNWISRSIVTPIINRFNDIRSAFKVSISAGLGAVLNSVRGPINDMISGLNAVKNKIPIANMLPNIPMIPRLAKGGIVSSATLALVGEGSQSEAVAPLDKLQGFITNAVASAVGANGGNGDIVLNIDGRTFARIINPHLAKESDRIGKNVRLKPI